MLRSVTSVLVTEAFMSDSFMAEDTGTEMSRDDTKTIRNPVAIQYEKDEPMLMPSNDRFVMFPIQHDDIWEAYKQHMACFGPPKR